MTCGQAIGRSLAAGMVAAACWSEDIPAGGASENGICLDAPCSDLLSIDVSRRDEEDFTPGDYTFSVEIDQGSPMIVDCTLSNAASLSCGGDTNDIAIRLNDAVDTFSLRIDNVSPEQVLVLVYLDDTEIGADILFPDYEYIVGDDPDCTETCVQGTANIHVAFPTT